MGVAGQLEIYRRCARIALWTDGRGRVGMSLLVGIEGWMVAGLGDRFGGAVASGDFASAESGLVVWIDYLRWSGFLLEEPRLYGAWSDECRGEV